MRLTLAALLLANSVVYGFTGATLCLIVALAILPFVVAGMFTATSRTKGLSE